jgi:regulator of sirC expression with transglutaminase-like and TPR domain
MMGATRKGAAIRVTQLLSRVGRRPQVAPPFRKPELSRIPSARSFFDMAAAPRYCRLAAYELFVAHLPTLEQTHSLLRAAVAVSMHELTGGSTDAVEKSLDRLAQQVNRRVRSKTPQALVARLHEVLFDEHGFTGNVDDYYTPENSYVSRVLETRKGIPVTLSLIYKCVAQRLGLTVRGINSPVHFLTSVEVDGSWMTIDPFEGGRVLTRDEIFARLEKAAGAPIARSDAFLATATHPQWLARIIRNLEQIFLRDGRDNDRLAMGELLALIPAPD